MGTFVMKRENPVGYPPGFSFLFLSFNQNKGMIKMARTPPRIPKNAPAKTSVG
jgi:hypothetical protein